MRCVTQGVLVSGSRAARDGEPRYIYKDSGGLGRWLGRFRVILVVGNAF